MKLHHHSTIREGVDFYGQAQRQLPYATSLALNRVGQHILDALARVTGEVFDRPTPYTMRALRLVRSTKHNLVATVDYRDGAGNGLSADKYLPPHVLGGGRRLKRSERALSRVGLPTGAFTVPAAGAEIDAYGNMSRGQVVRLLSYLQAFGEQGYRANSTPRSRARTAKVGRSPEGYKRINGVQYFVSRGKGSMSGNREQRLAAGVWQKTGTHGIDVKPVLLAVAQPSYTQRFPFYETAEAIYGERYDSEFSTALDLALSTAR